MKEVRSNKKKQEKKEELEKKRQFQHSKSEERLVSN
jgi:hypothetical protein